MVPRMTRAECRHRISLVLEEVRLLQQRMGYPPERAGRLRWQFGNWGLAPHLELSDEGTVHPQPTRFENFFFMHEIVQLVLRSNDPGSTYLACGTSSEHDERKEFERRVSET